jgi:hypothetical protein
MWQTPGHGNIFTFSNIVIPCVVAKLQNHGASSSEGQSTLDFSVPEDDACRNVRPGADLAVGSVGIAGGCLVSPQARPLGAMTGAVAGLRSVLPLRTKQKVACSRALQQGD